MSPSILEPQSNAQLILLFLIMILWLGVGNLIILDSYRRQKISYLSNLFNLWSKLQISDLLKIFFLILVIAFLAYLMIVLDKYRI